MTPYYDDGTCTIYHGDAREILPSLSAESVDVLLTDPPYGIEYKAMRAVGVGDIANDKDRTLAVVRQVLVMVPLPPVAYVFCDWRSMPEMTSAMVDAGWPPKACIVWDKERGVQNLDRFAKAHELILYSGPYGGQKTRDIDVWRCQRDFQPDHPTPKPVSLLVRALDYADAGRGQLVLDPFMGSGSTLRAAKDIGCKAIGIEIEERYCEIAAKRLAQEVLPL